MSCSGNRRFAYRGVRHWLQLSVFVVTVGIGLQFAVHVHQTGGPGPVTVARPPGVEGFLPIGALMAWKRFAATGQWDAVHPAAMVILGFAAMASLLIRKSFCSWFCPVGTLSEWLWKLGDRLVGRSLRIPVWLDAVCRSLKYFLLGFFLFIIFFKMSARDIGLFLESPYYWMADVKMLHFFTRMSGTTAVVLGCLALLSICFRNFWCRYLCPYGALMGIFALVGPTAVRRRESSCVGCGRCETVCPAHLPVSRKRTIRSPECSGCMDCVRMCPEANALRMGPRIWSRGAFTASGVGVAVVVLFVGLVSAARFAGHWQSRLTVREFRMGLRMIDSPMMRHPSIRIVRPTGSVGSHHGGPVWGGKPNSRFDPNG